MKPDSGFIVILSLLFQKCKKKRLWLELHFNPQREIRTAENDFHGLGCFLTRFWLEFIWHFYRLTFWCSRWIEIFQTSSELISTGWSDSSGDFLFNTHILKNSFGSRAAKPKWFQQEFCKPLLMFSTLHSVPVFHSFHRSKPKPVFIDIINMKS